MMGDQIQPLQEHTADFDGPDRKTHEESNAFLRQREGQDLWFEVIADDVRE